MSAIAAIRGFRMYRGRLDDRKLDDEHLRQIIDAARWAPSGHNSQPCEFLVVDDRALIGEIAVIAMRCFDEFLASSPHLPQWVASFHRWLRWSREDLERHGDGIWFQHWTRTQWEELAGLHDEAAIRERLVAMFGSGGVPSKLIDTAPCLLFTLLDTTRRVPDFSNDMLALTSAGAALQNLRLAAWEIGVAVHEQSPLYDLPATRQAVGVLLGIPGHYRIVSGMRLGYRTKAVRSSFTHVRRPVAQILHRNGF